MDSACPVLNSPLALQVVFASGKHAGKKGTVTLYQTSWYSVELPDGSVVKSRPGNLQVGGGSIASGVAVAPAKPRAGAKSVAKKAAALPKGRKKAAATPKAGTKAAAKPKAASKAETAKKVKGAAPPTRRVTGENTHFFLDGTKAPAGSLQVPQRRESTFRPPTRLSHSGAGRWRSHTTRASHSRAGVAVRWCGLATPERERNSSKDSRIFT